MTAWTDTQQTMALAYQQICSGEDPWVALGNFTNDFFATNDLHQRESLIQDPILELPIISQTSPAGNPSERTYSAEDLHRWAVFCAASVEYLCQTYSLIIPSWIYTPQFVGLLPEPWFFSPAAATKPRLRTRLEQETPDVFKARNIYCGTRVFLDKRAEAEKLRQLLSA